MKRSHSLLHFSIRWTCEHQVLMGMECEWAFSAQCLGCVTIQMHLYLGLTSKMLKATLLGLDYKSHEVTQVLIKTIISRISPLKMDMSLSKWHLIQRSSNIAVTTVAIKYWLLIMLIIYDWPDARNQCKSRPSQPWWLHGFLPHNHWKDVLSN